MYRSRYTDATMNKNWNITTRTDLNLFLKHKNQTVLYWSRSFKLGSKKLPTSYLFMDLEQI